MSKEKKESVPVAVRMEKGIYNRLNAFCDTSGQNKTVAIERALAMYIDDYDMKQARINELK